MKVSIVPAEMTSVQDKIIGNLNITQVVLLTLPLIFSIIIFLVIPPFSKTSILKIFISGILLVIFGIMSINIEGKIILEHSKIIYKYLIRPKIYLHTLREFESESFVELVPITSPKISETPPPILDRNNYFNLKKKDKLIFNLNKEGGLDAKVLRTI
jgi:PrgI family protein